MKIRLTIAVLTPIICGLLLIVAPSPGSAQCGPGGAGCGGGCSPYGMYCDGVACAVPGNPTLSPGYCGPAQEAAGGYEVYGAGQCGNDQYGACICYLPQHVYQITRDCYIRFPPIVAQTLSEELVQEGPTAACVLRSASG